MPSSMQRQTNLTYWFNKGPSRRTKTMPSKLNRGTLILGISYKDAGRDERTKGKVKNEIRNSRRPLPSWGLEGKWQGRGAEALPEQEPGQNTGSLNHSDSGRNWAQGGRYWRVGGKILEPQRERDTWHLSLPSLQLLGIPTGSSNTSVFRDLLSHDTDGGKTREWIWKQTNKSLATCLNCIQNGSFSI